MNSVVLNKLNDLVLIEKLITRFVCEYPESVNKSPFLSIVCDEIISNIFNNNETSVTVEVRLEYAVNEISLTFIDNGKIFDPTNYKVPETPHEGFERQVGGLGISIVKRISDSVSYKSVNGKNHLNVKIKI